MKKRLLSIILIGLMIFSLSIDGFIYANEDERPEYQPDLIIESVNTPVANAGSNYSFSFKIKNAGDVSANDIVITPVFESGKSPFNLGSNERYTIDKLNPKSSRDVRMSFKVEGNVAEDSYPMTLNFQYRYGGKNGVTKKDSFTQKLNIRVVNENTSPQLFISRATTSPENIQPGQSAKLRIGLANKGTVVAKNVRVTLGGLNSKGFYLAKGSDKTSINRVLGNDEEFVAYDLKASNTMLPGGYELEVKVQYDYAGNLVEDTQKIYLNIGSKSGKNSNVAIENLRFTTTPVKPNNNANISFTVKNKGQLNAKNIIVKVESAEGSGVVPTSQSILKIGGMKPGQSRDLNFRFMPTPGSETRNYPINITVEYVDELNESTQNKYIVTEYAGIYVYNPPKKEVKPKEPGPEHKPKLIIDKYSFSPQIVKAGENFTMNLSFYNTNSKKSVKNIKIFLTSDEKTEEDTGGGGNSVFTPVETSNTFYIENIPPKGRVEKSIKMFTVPDAKAKTYTVVANFEYEDAKAKEYTATELIGVPVVQKSKLDIGQLNIAGEMYQNEGSPLNVEFYNTGKVTLYNLMVRVEGNFQKESGTLFVGNFEPGSSEVFDDTIIPSDIGKLEGELVFSYEDSTGEIIEKREKFSSNVVEGMTDEGDIDGIPEEDLPMPIWKKLLIGLVVGVIALFIFKKIRNKRKSKKEQEELENWDEDELDDSLNIENPEEGLDQEDLTNDKENKEEDRDE